jgi:hypothetical protein
MKFFAMKQSFFYGMLALLLWACSTVKESSKTPATLTKNCQDSTIYEITITDPGFEQWYLVNYSPSKDFTSDYYRNKNLLAVSTWNDYYRTGRHPRIIDFSIDYWPNIDYGIEVNRKLFWYFKYLEDNYHLHLFGGQQIP